MNGSPRMVLPQLLSLPLLGFVIVVLSGCTTGATSSGQATPTQQSSPARAATSTGIPSGQDVCLRLSDLPPGFRSVPFALAAQHQGGPTRVLFYAEAFRRHGKGQPRYVTCVVRAWKRPRQAHTAYTHTGTKGPSGTVVPAEGARPIGNESVTRVISRQGKKFASIVTTFRDGVFVVSIRVRGQSGQVQSNDEQRLARIVDARITHGQG